MLTARQEKFALNLFLGMSNREAWVQAGYSNNYSMAVLDVNASRLANQTKVQLRIDELRAKVASDAIGTVEERQKRLTEIYRAQLVDFISEDGEPILSRDIPHHQAAAEYEVVTRYNKSGEPYIVRKVKLRDPVSAIQEHNKMDKLYSSEGGNTYNDIKILVVYESDGDKGNRNQITEAPRQAA